MITFRKASVDDIEIIMEIEKAGFIEKIQEEKSVFLQRILICPETFLIFEIDNKKAGYLCAEYLSTIPKTPEELKLGHFPQTVTEKNYLYISSFSLLPEFRGNGNGKLCWNLALNSFENKVDFLLLVNEAWQGARHIYEKSGFKTINTFEKFFPAENNSFTNGILMLKTN